MKQEMKLTEKEELEIIPKSGIVTPMIMLQSAREQGASVEQMQQLMEMQFKWENNEARKAYMVAVAEFKAQPIVITKDKVNSQYRSRYTSIGNLVNTTNAELSKYGLNAHWEIDQSVLITVTCILSHSLGHSESTSITAPADESGSKNQIQEIKSTITYLKVATYEAITGVASTDDPGDTDGNTIEYINDEQIANINSLITEVKPDKENFLKFLKAESVDTIQMRKYKRAVSELEKKRT